MSERATTREQIGGYGGSGTGNAAETARPDEGWGKTAEQARAVAADTLGATKQKTDEMIDQVTAKADMGIDQAAAGLGRASDLLREKAGGGEENGLQSAAVMAADKLDAAAGYLRERDSDQLVADLEALVRRRPVESIAIAAGLGFLLARAFR